MEKKEKIGRVVYYTALIVAIIVMLSALFIRSDGSESENIRVSNLRYMIAFYSFLGIISPSILVYEYCKGKYDLKIYKLKIVALSAALIIGTVIYILVDLPAVISTMFLVSILVFIFVLSPSKKDK